MIARSPAWIIVAGAVLVQASGVLSTAGSALIGIDNAIKATIDLKKIVAKIVPPQKPTPVNSHAPNRTMPTKAPKR